MKSTSFERFAGLCAVLAGIAVFLYSVTFFISARAPGAGPAGLLNALFQALGGLLTTAALVGVYDRLRESDPSFALWAVLLGIVGAVGSMIHGGYDLANDIHPPSQFPDVPHFTDPRGLLTFGIAGIALLFIAWLIGRSRRFPQGLGYLGYLLAILLIVIYLGRLIILNPANPVLLAAVVLAGFIVNPVWYIWLGLVLWRGRSA